MASSCVHANDVLRVSFLRFGTSTPPCASTAVPTADRNRASRITRWPRPCVVGKPTLPFLHITRKGVGTQKSGPVIAENYDNVLMLQIRGEVVLDVRDILAIFLGALKRYRSQRHTEWLKHRSAVAQRPKWAAPGNQDGKA